MLTSWSCVLGTIVTTSRSSLGLLSGVGRCLVSGKLLVCDNKLGFDHLIAEGLPI